MTCHEAREWLSRSADGALEVSERRRLETHLSDCAECRQERDRFHRTVALLRAIERPRAPVGFVERVMRAVRPEPWYRRLLRAIGASRPIRVPVEAAGLVLAATLVIWLFHGDPELRRAAEPPGPSGPHVKSGSPHREELSATSAADRGLDEAVAASTPPSKMAEMAGGAASRSSRGDAPDARQQPREDAARATALRPDAGVPDAPAGRTSRQRFALTSPERPPSPDAAQHPRRSIESAAQEREARIAPRPGPTAGVVGRLIVRDHGAADRQLAALLSRTGAVETARRREGGVTSIHVDVPPDAYPDFSRGLAEIGAWAIDAEHADPSARRAVIVRITEEAVAPHDPDQATSSR